MRDTRQQFEHALFRLAKFDPWQQTFQAQFEVAALRLWNIKHPGSKMKFSILRKRHFDTIRPLFEGFKARALIIDNRHSAQRQRLRALLDQLALTLPIRRSNTRWRRVWSNCSSNYSTQGFGAGTYARNSVENQADTARAAGIPVVIRSQTVKTNPDSFTHFAPTSISYYEAWCPIDSDVDVELLQRKSRPSIVEQVRLCWKRGVNPRVYHYFLPPDFETKHGLDYFGGMNQQKVK